MPLFADRHDAVVYALIHSHVCATPEEARARYDLAGLADVIVERRFMRGGEVLYYGDPRDAQDVSGIAPGYLVA